MNPVTNIYIYVGSRFLERFPQTSQSNTTLQASGAPYTVTAEDAAATNSLSMTNIQPFLVAKGKPTEYIMI